MRFPGVPCLMPFIVPYYFWLQAALQSRLLGVVLPFPSVRVHILVFLDSIDITAFQRISVCTYIHYREFGLAIAQYLRDYQILRVHLCLQ